MSFLTVAKSMLVGQGCFNYRLHGRRSRRGLTFALIELAKHPPVAPNVLSARLNQRHAIWSCRRTSAKHFACLSASEDALISSAVDKLSSVSSYNFFGSSSSSITCLSKRPAPPPSMLRWSKLNVICASVFGTNSFFASSHEGVFLPTPRPSSNV
jgi:hypothetical protein